MGLRSNRTALAPLERFLLRAVPGPKAVQQKTPTRFRRRVCALLEDTNTGFGLSESNHERGEKKFFPRKKADFVPVRLSFQTRHRRAKRLNQPVRIPIDNPCERFLPSW